MLRRRSSNRLGKGGSGFSGRDGRWSCGGSRGDREVFRRFQAAVRHHVDQEETILYAIFRERARRLRNAVEPVAAGVYFAPEAIEAASAGVA